MQSQNHDDTFNFSDVLNTDMDTLFNISDNDSQIRTSDASLLAQPNDNQTLSFTSFINQFETPAPDLNDQNNVLFDSADLNIDSILHNGIPDTDNNSNVYTHANDAIPLDGFGFADTDDQFTSSNDVLQQTHNSEVSPLIDEDLLSEIDRMIGKSANHQNTPLPEVNYILSSQQKKLAEIESTGTHTPKLVKKPSFKRLSTSESQSPTTKRLAKSPSRQNIAQFSVGMAQTAAVVAIGSSTNKISVNLQRHESARAAAKAVGNTYDQRKQQNVYDTSHKRNERLVNLSIGDKTQPVFLLENSAKSPKRHPKNKYRVKPSSCSIYSSATLNSVKTDISNFSNTSNTSKHSNSSKDSGVSNTFDIYTHIPGSSETLETIFSKDADDKYGLFIDPVKNYCNNTNVNTKTMKFTLSHPTKHPNLQHPNFQHPNIEPTIYNQNINDTNSRNNHFFNDTIDTGSRRAHSTQSNHSSCSTTSLNDFLRSTSTPSPISNPNPYSNSTFTPPNLMNSQNRKQSLASLTTTDSDHFNPSLSPLTPISKTTAKFDKLSTHSPAGSVNNKVNQIQFNVYTPNIIPTPQKTSGQLDYIANLGPSAIPKLSVWKTSPTETKNPGTFETNTIKFTNNFIGTNVTHRKPLKKSTNASVTRDGTCSGTVMNNRKMNKHVSKNKTGFSTIDFNKNSGSSYMHYTGADGRNPANTNTSLHSATASQNGASIVQTSSIPSTAGICTNTQHPSLSMTTDAKSRARGLPHKCRDSLNSVHSGTSTNSTISNSSTAHDDVATGDGKIVGTAPPSDKASKNGTNVPTNNRKPLPQMPGSGRHSQNGKTKKLSSAKDAPFKNLITTFNKKEPENLKPKVYSSMRQGLVEFQVKLGNK